MGLHRKPIDGAPPPGFMARLARDTSGNTLALLTAALVPLLAMIGGGIDMGRSYLSQSRLQEACDAGVLAARKKLGAEAPVSGEVPAAVGAVGQRFFDFNFRSGAYGTEDREFEMTLEDDYSISGEARVIVPTSVMRVFGFDEVPLTVTCEAKLNFSNTDVMMVLDTTGSMNQTNPGDSESKLAAMRRVVKNFHAQLEASKNRGTRIRYGFVPYSTNVNVGGLLQSDWLVDKWTYQGRRARGTGTFRDEDQFSETRTPISGTRTAIAPYDAASCPASTLVTTRTSQTFDPDGTERGTINQNGTEYSCTYPDSGSLTVRGTTYNQYQYSYVRVKVGTKKVEEMTWEYAPWRQDLSDFVRGGGEPPRFGKITVPMNGDPDNVSGLEAWFRGCVEERQTYEIGDYDNVDLSKALDLDLDLVPSPDDPDTQWRPMLNDISFVRALNWDGTGSLSQDKVRSRNNFVNAQWAGLSACPSPALRLQPMSASAVSSYVDSLVAAGSTYHDIGMIWGGRLLSPTGLFAEDNADADGQPTSRDLIFLTDGETAPLDISYGSYGIEAIEKPRRRWSPGSSLTLTQTVEKRFSFACDEVKRKNITVWVVSFGMSLNPVLSECAGPGHAFEAKDADQLNEVFNSIAKAMGDLRISR